MTEERTCVADTPLIDVQQLALLTSERRPLRRGRPRRLFVRRSRVVSILGKDGVRMLGWGGRPLKEVSEEAKSTIAVWSLAFRYETLVCNETYQAFTDAYWTLR